MRGLQWITMTLDLDGGKRLRGSQCSQSVGVEDPPEHPCIPFISEIGEAGGIPWFIEGSAGRTCHRWWSGALKSDLGHLASLLVIENAVHHSGSANRRNLLSTSSSLSWQP